MPHRIKKPIDMCNGPIIPQLIRFVLPMIAASILQLLYNAADLIVVGQFNGSSALAAVGATGSLVNLIVNLFIGLSIGANVIIARARGAKDDETAAAATHTAIVIALLCGLITMLLGLTAAKQLLIWMGTPTNVLPDATVYIRVLAIGFPASLLYNFGAATMRANGDIRRPLYFLLVSGMVNVGLNLLFVIVWRMGVAGVALATILSQYVSAALVIMALRRMDGPCRLHLRRLRIHKQELFTIFAIGLPTGLQSVFFSLSNVLIQSAINSFGSYAMAGSAAAANIESFIYAAMDAVAQALLTFIGQNYGAKNFRRIPRLLYAASLLVILVHTLMSSVIWLLRFPLASFYAKSDPTVMAYCFERLQYFCLTYFIAGIMNCHSHALRALGHSTLSMIISLIGACGLRILTIYTVFRWKPALATLYISYPVSWALTLLALATCFWYVYRRLLRKQAQIHPPEEAS